MKRFINSLTGRFLVLTIIFVMIAEVLIFVPSVARFRVDYLQERLELSQIASLSLLATPTEMVSEDLTMELLKNAEVLNIVLRRDNMRELILSEDMPAPVEVTYDIRYQGPFELIRDAMITLVQPRDRIVRVIGMPVKGGGVMIEATLHEQPLRDAMIRYGMTILWLSLVISLITAGLLFLSVRRFIVKPMERVVTHMTAYRDNPEDAQRIIKPKSNVSELMAAEVALADLQTQLTQSLKQKDRLATLGGAVSRISHDLRNMLTTAQLLADRFERSEDPTVKRTAPKLLGSLDRAINLCERTLTFGKAEEPAPQIMTQPLAPIVRDVMENDRLRAQDNQITLVCDVDEAVEVDVDAEQLYRVFSNLIRNARQAITATGGAGEISVRADDGSASCVIEVADTGPGLPPRALENIFQPFKGGVRRGGSGLGLAIAAELVRGHGGALELIETSDVGTRFRIVLPKRMREAS
ncbi:MAG: HAMP domain-containing sensor histidine kinase [Pseudomonadota bacterium]